jgi:hypothetical protein
MSYRTAGTGWASYSLVDREGRTYTLPKLIESYLEELKRHHCFPLIDLQTNGVLFDPNMENHLLDYLHRWQNLGLTLVCFSIAHCDPVKNAALMQVNKKYRHYDYIRAVQAVKKLGLAIRLNVTMLNSGLHTEADMEIMVDLAQRYDIEQLTFREVSKPSDPICPKTAAVVEKECPHGASKRLYHYLQLKGANRLPDLAHGAMLFDYRGQNVSVNHCLTDTLDSNDIRQIIFFPSGEIAYDWKYRGARIL